MRTSSEAVQKCTSCCGIMAAGGEAVSAGFTCSVTVPVNRKPLRAMVRISRCASPLSPIALRAALMRVASVESETMRPPQTEAMRSSLLTTRSRFCIR